MTPADLATRLRELANMVAYATSEYADPVPTLRQAADSLAALEAEKDELEERVETLLFDRDGWLVWQAKLRAVVEAARSLLTNSPWSVPSKELVDLHAALAALDAGEK